jgi:hypothetical protein
MRTLLASCVALSPQYVPFSPVLRISTERFARAIITIGRGFAKQKRGPERRGSQGDMRVSSRWRAEAAGCS